MQAHTQEIYLESLELLAKLDLKSDSKLDPEKIAALHTFIQAFRQDWENVGKNSVEDITRVVYLKNGISISDTEAFDEKGNLKPGLTSVSRTTKAASLEGCLKYLESLFKHPDNAKLITPKSIENLRKVMNLPGEILIPKPVLNKKQKKTIKGLESEIEIIGKRLEKIDENDAKAIGNLIAQQRKLEDKITVIAEGPDAEARRGINASLGGFFNGLVTHRSKVLAGELKQLRQEGGDFLRQEVIEKELREYCTEKELCSLGVIVSSGVDNNVSIGVDSSVGNDVISSVGAAVGSDVSIGVGNNVSTSVSSNRKWFFLGGAGIATTTTIGALFTTGYFKEGDPFAYFTPILIGFKAEVPNMDPINAGELAVMLLIGVLILAYAGKKLLERQKTDGLNKGEGEENQNLISEFPKVAG